MKPNHDNFHLLLSNSDSQGMDVCNERINTNEGALRIKYQCYRISFTDLTAKGNSSRKFTEISH